MEVKDRLVIRDRREYWYKRKTKEIKGVAGINSYWSNDTFAADINIWKSLHAFYKITQNFSHIKNIKRTAWRQIVLQIN